jgi:hypothetical protein
LRRRANEIGTASNSAEKKGSPSRLGIKTSKQNNFQFLLRKNWRAGVKKLNENCFALLAEFRRVGKRSYSSILRSK